MHSRLLAKAIRFLYYILFFIVPFVVYPKTSELFEFNKMIVIYIFAVLIGTLWLLRMSFERRILFTKTPLDIPIAIFFLSQLLSTLFSIDKHTSFFGYYGRFNGGLVSLVSYLTLYYCFVEHMKENQLHSIKRFFSFSIVSSIGVTLWGLSGKLNHDLSCLIFSNKFDNSCWTDQFRPAERMFSTLGQPNWLGAYIAIVFFIGLFFYLQETGRKKWLYLLYSTGMFITILFTRSRSALASLVPGFVLFFFFGIWMYLRKKDKKIIISMIFLLIAFVFSLFVFKTGIPSVDTYLTFKRSKPNKQIQAVPRNNQISVQGNSYNVSESFDIRKIVWDGAIKLGMEYPLFGTGVETFGYAYYFVRPAAHNLTSEWDYLYNKAHNEYLNYFATTGWFGLLSLLVLIFFTFFLFAKQLFLSDGEHKFLPLTMMGIYSSICITNFFGFSTSVINLFWFTLLGFTVNYTFHKKQEKVRADVRAARPIVTIMIGCLSVYLLFSIVVYWFADRTYAEADGALKVGTPAGIQAAVSYFNSALSLRNEHVYEDKQSYAMAQLAFIAAYQKQPETAKQLIQESEQLNLKSIQASPMNILYWKTRIKNQYIYYQMSLNKQYLLTGMSALEEAIKLSPTDPKIPYFSATYYSLLYDEEKNGEQKKAYQEKALSSIEQAIKLKKSYGDAYYLKVQLYKKYGMKQQAKELLNWYIPIFAPGNEGMIKELQEL